MTYKSLEVADAEILQKIGGPHVYTDGSKLEDKISPVRSSNRYCTRCTKRVKSRSEPKISVPSYSKFSLELLIDSKAKHPLAKPTRENIREIRAGNEKADGLFKAVALHSDSSSAYDKVSLSYVKKFKTSLSSSRRTKCQTSRTGKVTKRFLPNVKETFRVIRDTKLTTTEVQILTEHGEITAYLHRFHHKDDPGCKCDSKVKVTVWYTWSTLVPSSSSSAKTQNRKGFHSETNTQCHGQLQN
ncbi:hypothetical protein EVAR_1008_1 [Eumeta japonica]|uniref:Uncharacterized protein n=1 Tax=Eumeta variegata TaxID=151549 RepID=A0A4C1SEG6_EUMVA|nr:hypothetical protein EVAR_1008_1 [Eumeta japonica]